MYLRVFVLLTIVSSCVGAPQQEDYNEHETLPFELSTSGSQEIANWTESTPNTTEFVNQTVSIFSSSTSTEATTKFYGSKQTTVSPGVSSPSGKAAASSDHGSEERCDEASCNMWMWLAIAFASLVFILTVVSIVFLVLILKGRRRPKRRIHTSADDDATSKLPSQPSSQQQPLQTTEKKGSQTPLDQASDAREGETLTQQGTTLHGSGVAIASFVPTNQIV